MYLDRRAAYLKRLRAGREAGLVSQWINIIPRIHQQLRIVGVDRWRAIRGVGCLGRKERK